MTDQQKEAFIERMLERARVKAVYSAYRVDAATGYIYVLDQTPADLGDDVATLHVLDSAGRYLAKLSFDRRWRTFEVADDRIYALEVEPATGLTALVAYEIDVTRPYTNR